MKIFEMKPLGNILLRVIASATLLLFVALVSRAQKWQRLGPEGGDVISLASGEKGEVFLGTADGHVIMSRDGGERWELRGRVGKRMDSVVQELVVDARVKTTLYAAAWTQDPAAGGGVYRSEDGGVRWQSMGLEGEAARALAQSASSPEVLVAGTRTGVFKTSDAGKTWTRISPAGDSEIKNLDSIAIDPRDTNVIYAGTYHLPWKTTDGGKTWNAIAAGMIDDSDVMSVEIDRSNPERIFASACSGIYRSENGGAQWVKLQGIPYASRRTQQILQDPANASVWYAGTTEGLWRTSDAGESWTRVTARDVVVNAIALPFPEKAGVLLIGTEAEGVWMSRDGGNSFAARNAGFSHRVLSGFTGEGKDHKHLLAATGEGSEGLFESMDAGKNWKRMPDAPVGVTALFSSSENWLAALRRGGAVQYEVGAKKWKELRFVVRNVAGKAQKRSSRQTVRAPEKVVKPEVLAMEVAGGRIFAATRDGLWSGSLHEGKLVRIAEKEFAGKVTYVNANAEGTELFALEKNSIARSTNAGKSWIKTTVPEKAGEVLWLKVQSNDQRPVVVGTEKGVFEFTWDTEAGWRLLQSGLPAAASWPGWIAQDVWVIPMRTAGVYISRDAGRNWERVNEGDVGRVVTITGDGHGGFFVGTKTDGVLRWVAEKE